MTVAAGTGAFAGAVALALLLAGWRRGQRAGELAGDLAGWVGLAALTCWLYAPYLRGTLVGAGDAYHYALQVADYVTQLRAGHFPIFVGESAYAFNGNIHTLRDAPYFLHFAGLVDLLTGRRLSFVQLLDLTIMVHALGLALAAWRVARSLIGPANPAWAVGLAALYALSPAIANTLQSSDLVATFLTLPWLPFLVWAMVRLLEDEDPWRGAVVGSGALALVWWAHPAVAGWGTALWVAAWGIALGRRRAGPARWLAALASAGGLAAMTAYCFVSVQALRLGASFGPSADIRAAIGRALANLWPGFIVHPFRDPSIALRPGFALWIAGLGAVLAWRGRSLAVNGVAAAIAGLSLFLGAIPALTGPLWRLVPGPVLQATHSQPVQRLAPILAALLLAAGALGLRRLGGPPRPGRWLAAIGLAILVAWSVQAIAPGRQYASDSTRSAAETAAALDPRNVILTWSSYGMFPHLPRTFTHGRSAAPWEVRLLADDTGAVIASNAASVVAAAQARGEAPPLQPIEPFAVIPTRRDLGYVLEFVFAHPMAPGEIQLTGGALRRSYALPSSGEVAAFGSAPGNAYLIGFEPDEHDGPAIRVHADEPGVSVRAYPFDPASLPLQVPSLMPLRVPVAADQAAWLETPRLWIPGYRGRVDGAEVPVTRSPEGFAMMRVPAGRHVAEVRYAAPMVLTGAYGFSLFALVGWMAILPLAWRPRPAAVQRGRAPRTAGIIGLVAALGLGAWYLHGPPAGDGGERPQAPASPPALPAPVPGSGAVRLAIVLPAEVTQPTEPLLVTGKTGAADLVEVRYLPDRRLQLGFDHWGVGGPFSAPVDYTPGTREEVEVEYAALFEGSPSTPPEYRDREHSRVIVRWNGKPVLDFEAATHPGLGGGCVAGVNSVGAGSCSPRFSGTILRASRFPPGSPPGAPGN